MSNADYPFQPQSAAEEEAGMPHTGYRQVLRCRLHVDHTPVWVHDSDDEGDELKMPMTG